MRYLGGGARDVLNLAIPGSSMSLIRLCLTLKDPLNAEQCVVGDTVPTGNLDTSTASQEPPSKGIVIQVLGLRSIGTDVGLKLFIPEARILSWLVFETGIV